MTARLTITVEQLAAPVPGGIATYTRGLLQGLAELEVAHELAASAPARAAAAGASASDVLHLRHRLTTALWHRGLGRMRSGLVHATSLSCPPVDQEAVLSVMVHDLAWRANPQLTSSRGARWHEQALERVLARANLLTVPSQPVAEDLAAAGADPGRVHVVGEGADHLPAADLEGAQALLRSRGSGRPFLLVAGTLEPRKNLPATVGAYRESGLDAEGVDLCIVGPSGWGEVDGIEGPGVHLLGGVDAATLHGLYRRAEALVYLPLAEGFGLPPLEAMSAGTAVLASTAVPSVAEGAGTAALVVDPRDQGAMVEAIGRIGRDAQLRRDLATEGRAFAAARSWRHVAARHLEVWGLR